MINAQQARDRNVRQGISDNILKLINRAQGLDILLYAEQDRVSNKLIPLEDAEGNIGEVIGEGYTLSKIDHLGAHFERLDGIFYPVPGFVETHLDDFVMNGGNRFINRAMASGVVDDGSLH